MSGELKVGRVHEIERVVFWDALPRTSVGKIQKHVVREQLAHDESGL